MNYLSGFEIDGYVLKSLPVEGLGNSMRSRLTFNPGSSWSCVLLLMLLLFLSQSTIEVSPPKCAMFALHAAGSLCQARIP